MCQENKSPVKLCVKCEKVKTLEGGYYRAGKKSWQKLCKICHNEKRIEYNNNKEYTPKPTGFKKLPLELQNKIIYDVYIQINFKDITKKYVNEYPKLRHQTLLKWNRNKQIAKYIPLTAI